MVRYVYSSNDVRRIYLFYKIASTFGTYETSYFNTSIWNLARDTNVRKT